MLGMPALEGLDLATWGRDHRTDVDRWLHEAGAVLFRGFGLARVEQFEAVAGALMGELYAGYGDLPRAGASDRIYASTPYPPDQTILFHNESSHLPSWPMRIAFFCAHAAAEGGETPILDCREICRKLDPSLLSRFREQGLMYVRNFSPGLDVSWQAFFGTDDRGAVETACREGGIEWEWRSGDRLRVRHRCPAVARHPHTGEETFFNQVQLHHVACLPAPVRESLGAILAEDDLPRNVLFGDGTPISDEVVHHLAEIYWGSAVVFPWERGDVVLLDNMLTAHARLPYRGERRIAVAMAQMQTLV